MSEPVPNPATKPSLKCFVILPFSATQHEFNGTAVTISGDQWKFIFQNWIKRAVESYPGATIDCKCSGANPGNFIKGIVADIDQSEIVIADLTGSRPNVYYELGIRHALRTGTIIMSQDLNALPSDLKNYYCFEYRYTSHTHENESFYGQFEKDMHLRIEYVVRLNFPKDSPVSDFLGYKRYGQLIEFEQNDRLIGKLLSKLHDECKRMHDEAEGILALLEAGQCTEENLIVALQLSVDPALVSEIYTRLILDVNWIPYDQKVVSKMVEYSYKMKYAGELLTKTRENNRLPIASADGQESFRGLFGVLQKMVKPEDIISVIEGLEASKQF